MSEPRTGRVLFVLNRLARGGMERMTLTLGGELARRGWRPVVACLADAGELADEARAAGIEVVDRLLRCKLDVRAAGRLRRLAAGAAAVVVVDPAGDRLFWAAMARGRRRAPSNPPLIAWEQTSPLPGRPTLRPWISRRLAGRVDLFAVQGPCQAKLLADIERLPMDRMAELSNCLAADRIAALSQPGGRDAARADLDVGPGEIAVLCVANPRPVKRLDLFCAAAVRLRASHPSARFRVVGDGPGRGELLATAERLGLAAPQFAWLGARADADRLWSGADVAVCCSDSEGLGVAILEAMAAGAAVVSTAVGEHPTLLGGGEAGLLVPPGDADALAGAIAQLADDAALRGRLAANARARVAEFYTAARTADAFESIVRRFTA
ncbi:MAG: D-inositol-3-phosphate glycosyltransferase [Phycisphaerae bacterium]|nr:D-inositol-3-phosphate glycosyltransferase [Phycisphaerae bacterium]